VTKLWTFGKNIDSEVTHNCRDNIIGSWTWLFSVLIWIAYDYKNYLRLKRQQTKLLKTDAIEEPKEEIKKLNDQINSLKLNLFRSVTDLQLAIYFCFPNTWPSQWVGVFGTVNALAGLYPCMKR
jgi:hypothetical protein